MLHQDHTYRYSNPYGNAQISDRAFFNFWKSRGRGWAYWKVGAYLTGVVVAFLKEFDYEYINLPVLYFKQKCTRKLMYDNDILQTLILLLKLMAFNKCLGIFCSLHKCNLHYTM